MLVRIGVAAVIVGVAEGTLRRWDREKKVQPAARTAGGHRRYESTTLKEQVARREHKTEKKSRRAYKRYRSNQSRNAWWDMPEYPP